MHESEKWKWGHSVVSDFSRPHGLQPTRLLHPWGFPGKSTGVGCYCKGTNKSSSVQSLSRVRLFATPWIAARQASLSITNSRSSLKLTSMESVMPSSHLILCSSLFLLPQLGIKKDGQEQATESRGFKDKQHLAVRMSEWHFRWRKLPEQNQGEPKYLPST